MPKKTYTLKIITEYMGRTSSKIYYLTYRGVTLWNTWNLLSKSDEMNATLDAYKWALADGATHIKHSETGKTNKI